MVFQFAVHQRVHSGLTNLDTKKKKLTMILGKTTLENYSNAASYYVSQNLDHVFSAPIVSSPIRYSLTVQLFRVRVWVRGS